MFECKLFSDFWWCMQKLCHLVVSNQSHMFHRVQVPISKKSLFFYSIYSRMFYIYLHFFKNWQSEWRVFLNKCAFTHNHYYYWKSMVLKSTAFKQSLFFRHLYKLRIFVSQCSLNDYHSLDVSHIIFGFNLKPSFKRS